MPLSILIVEDEAITAQELKETLQSLKYRVPAITDLGEEAIRLVKALSPDLVLMDIHLAGKMTGSQAAKKIAEFSPVPIVYLTAYSDSKTLKQAVQCGPYGYLTKPIDELALRTTLEVALFKNQMDRKLSTQKRCLAAVLNNISDGIIASDTRGKIAFMNPKAAELTGWPLNQAFNKDVGRVFQMTDKAVAPNSFPKIKFLPQAPFQKKMPVYLKRKDGNTLVLEESTTSLEGDHGEALGNLIVFHDISQIQDERLQLRLRDQAFEAIPRGLFILEPQGDSLAVVHANTAFLDITGVKRDQLFFFCLDFLKRGNRAWNVEPAAMSALNDNRVTTITVPCIRSDHTFFQGRFTFVPFGTHSAQVSHVIGVLDVKDEDS